MPSTRPRMPERPPNLPVRVPSRASVAGRVVLGNETGGAVISLDASRDVFALHAVCEDGTSYPAFEAKLTLFVKTLRYWKEWLAQPASSADSRSDEVFDTAGMLAI